MLWWRVSMVAVVQQSRSKWESHPLSVLNVEIEKRKMGMGQCVCWSVRIYFFCATDTINKVLLFFFNLSLNNKMNENGVRARSVYEDPCWGFVSITNNKNKRLFFVEQSWPGTHPWGVRVLISHCRTRPTWFSVDRRITHPWPPSFRGSLFRHG